MTDLKEQDFALDDTELGLTEQERTDLNTLFCADKPILIVPWEAEAEAVRCCGSYAISVKGKYEALLDMLKTNRPKQPLVICLENTIDGQDETNTLGAALEDMGILYSIADVKKMYDGKYFLGALAGKDGAITPEFVKAVEYAENKPKSDYMDKNSAGGRLQDFVDGITASVNTSCIPTGYRRLDKILDGGLYEGLYIMGAISSLGKTTFCLQMGDQIAKQGQDVLIFSLEMAQSELIAKSVSRESLLYAESNGLDIRTHAKTVRGVTVGSRYKTYSKDELTSIKAAINTYGSYADHVYITEGVGDIGVKQIRETIENHIAFTGNKPVVVVDYLQILAPADVRASDKQNTDKAVLELKRISRDLKLPVVAVSSFNRENYNTEVSMKAFKESGAIEYGCDVLMGLQFTGAGKKDFDENTAKKAIPRKVELVILKNRNGATGDKMAFEYYSMYNYFKGV